VTKLKVEGLEALRASDPASPSGTYVADPDCDTSPGGPSGGRVRYVKVRKRAF
jgi:hypothetical protein